MHSPLLIHFFTLSVGEDLIADTLLRNLKLKGIEVELRPERKTQAMMNGFNLFNGAILIFIYFTFTLDRSLIDDT